MSKAVAQPTKKKKKVSKETSNMTDDLGRSPQVLPGSVGNGSRIKKSRVGDVKMKEDNHQKRNQKEDSIQDAFNCQKCQIADPAHFGINVVLKCAKCNNIFCFYCSCRKLKEKGRQGISRDIFHCWICQLCRNQIVWRETQSDKIKLMEARIKNQKLIKVKINEEDAQQNEMDLQNIPQNNIPYSPIKSQSPSRQKPPVTAKVNSPVNPLKSQLKLQKPKPVLNFSKDIPSKIESKIMAPRKLQIDKILVVQSKLNKEAHPRAREKKSKRRSRERSSRRERRRSFSSSSSSSISSINRRDEPKFIIRDFNQIKKQSEVQQPRYKKAQNDHIAANPPKIQVNFVQNKFNSKSPIHFSSSQKARFDHIKPMDSRMNIESPITSEIPKSTGNLWNYTEKVQSSSGNEKQKSKSSSIILPGFHKIEKLDYEIQEY